MYREPLRKVTVKMEESLYQRIVRDADKGGGRVSEQIRQELRNNGSQTNLINEVCKSVFRIQKILDQYDIKEEDKRIIDEEVRKQWRLFR